MASIGDEKKIRALFSEQRFMDEQTAPSFTAVWQRAQSRSLKPRRAFNLSFAVATALLFCALLSLAIWAKYTQPATPVNVSAVLSAPNDFLSPPPKSVKENVAPASTADNNQTMPRSITGKARRSNLAGQRQLLTAENKRMEKEAKEITSWQSPTASLLSSPSDDLMKSLPQLNENANELKSFLPNRENDKEK